MALNAIYNANPPTNTSGEQVDLQTDQNGNLKVTNAGSPSGTQNVNITQVGGNAVTNSVPVSSTAPTDTYPAGGNITAQDIASVTVQGQFNQNQTTGTPTTASSITFAIAGYTTVALGISGTWTGTVTVEGATAPAGVTASTVWTNKTCRVPGSTLSTSIFTANASDILCNVAGYTHLRVRATAAMTGTAVVGAVAVSVNVHAFDLINPIKIVDGSGTTNTMTVKAASTTPLATDPAAVVSLSPNSAPTPTIGVNGTGIATQANPVPTSVNGVNGTGIATVANPLPTFEPDGGSTAAPVAANAAGLSATSAAVLFTVDTSGYNGISVQVTSPGTTCIITYEQSNDNSTWNSLIGQRADLAGGTQSATSTTASVIFLETGCRYFRARVSTYTSGTVTVGYALRRSPLLSQIGALSISSGSVQVPAVATGGYTYTNIAANGTTNGVKSGAGTLHSITINNIGVTASLSVFDNTTATGTAIATIGGTLNAGTLIYDCAFLTGLSVIAAGGTTGNFTLNWK